MPAYIIASVEVIDAEGFAPYRENVPKVVAQYGGQYLARGGTLHAVQGDYGMPRLTIIAFPSVEAARALYESPE